MTSPGTERVFLVNRWVDAAAAGGLSIVVYLGCLLLLRGGLAPLGVSVTLALFFMLNFPHFSATNWRLYRSWSNARLGSPVRESWRASRSSSTSDWRILVRSDA